jgi:arylsulfatase A-like enzyme
MTYDSCAVLVVSVHLAGGKMPTNSFMNTTCNAGVWKILKKKEFLVWCGLLLLHEYLYFSPMKNSFACILLLSVLFACQEKQASPPSFVFILVDDLGWADVGANWPQTFYETPNIDGLARRGIRFSQAYAAHPVCSPTRAALMTGKHPNRLNITDWIPGFDKDANTRPILTPQIAHELALEEQTIAEKLKESGYNTYFVGKWHLGEEEQFWPEHQGFDQNIGGWSVGAPQLKPGVANGYFSPYGNPRLTDGPEGEYLTDRLTDESIRLMTQSGDNPFLLYLSFYTVHTPIQAAVKHLAKFEDKKGTLVNEFDAVPYRKEGEGVTKLIQDNAAYASMVAAMDENVGRILKALEDAGLSENTWVIITSDNGGLSTLFTEGAPTANGPLRAGKGWCYEGGIRVPLVVAGPGIRSPGSIDETPVISMDFYPTLLSLAGIPHQSTDGRSLVPLFRDTEKLDRDELFWHYPHYHGSAWKPGSAIRKGDWKLVYTYEDKKVELYDLAGDPSETTDVSVQFPDRVQTLKALLDSRLEETEARYPVETERFF